MNNKNNNYELIYQLLEIKYMKSKNKPISSNIEDYYDIYPIEWFSRYNYEIKVKILVEALNKNILITETKEYQKVIEGIRQAI